MTKIKIHHTKTVRELTPRYDRVGIYYLEHSDVAWVVNTLLGIYSSLPDHFPALKAGDWVWEFNRPIEFQAISYTDITGWRMLLMVENEDCYGAFVTVAFSGASHVPMLAVRNFDCRFLKGEQLLIKLKDLGDGIQPPPKLTYWQRFKNWFRRKKVSDTSSGSSALDDIGDLVD